MYTVARRLLLQLFIAFLFFFQAEDGIRVKLVTGVQTCALPISRYAPSENISIAMFGGGGIAWADVAMKIGRASGRERVVSLMFGAAVKSIIALQSLCVTSSLKYALFVLDMLCHRY